MEKEKLFEKEIELFKQNNENDIKSLTNNLKLKDKIVNELNKSTNDQEIKIKDFNIRVNNYKIIIKKLLNELEILRSKNDSESKK